MVGINELHSQQFQESDCSFQWDEKSQLYYHSSTGFYYNPNAGWYYSSIDGLYYKFENGNYVLLGSNSDQGDHGEIWGSGEGNASGDSIQDKQYMSVEDGEFAAERLGNVSDKATADLECIESNQTEDPPPPSEWLEDTLIDLFLSGYPNKAVSNPDAPLPTKTNDIHSLDVPADGNNDLYELEEGEWIPDDQHGSTDSSANVFDEGTSWEETNWQAQYGQVSQPYEESISDFHVVDLWDWEMVRGTTKDGKSDVARLVGRLVKCSGKLHPSLPSHGTRLKTAPIHEAHLDLVRVKSGQIYKLRRPRRQYLSSLSAYDSSNPTNGWGFPQLSFNRQNKPLLKLDGHTDFQEASVSSEHARAKKEKILPYRDRAAERRALHGGIGIGPGQKKSPNAVDSAPSSPTSSYPEEAAAESMNISFGAGSYARRLLEGMGWKEGEALGGSMKGLVEPLQATGNKGNAGLGWDNSKRRHSFTGR